MYPFTPQPWGPPMLRPLRDLGNAACVLIALEAVAELLLTLTQFYAARTLRAYYFGSPEVSGFDADRSIDLILVVSVLATLALIAAGVVVVVWLWRARLNAEQLCFAPHRRSRGWVIGGWFCPVVNLWFPFMVVDDVRRASDPRMSRHAQTLGWAPRSALIGWWWATWLAGLIVGQLPPVGDEEGLAAIEAIQTGAVFSAVSTSLNAAAAVLLIVIIRRVGQWQSLPRYPF